MMQQTVKLEMLEEFDLGGVFYLGYGAMLKQLLDIMMSIGEFGVQKAVKLQILEELDLG